MNNEYEIFLNLTAAYLTGFPSDSLPENFDMERIFEIADSNFCVPVIYQGIVCSGGVCSDKWKLKSSYTIIDSYRKLTIESEIIDILRSRDIRCCILKGSSVAINYPNPLSRPMGDIDILVDECNYEKTALLFVSQEEFSQNEHSFHFGFNYKNVSVEIHKSFTEYSQDDEAVNKIVADAIEHICIKRHDNFDIPMLSEPYQAISLLTHMARHFKENKFVFRMFCDWVCFVRNLSDECWQKDVYHLIESFGLSLFSDALNKSAMLYLGFDMKSKVSSNIDDKTCEIMIEEFLSVDKSASVDGIDANIGTLLSTRYSDNNILTAYFASVNSIARRKYALGKYKIFQPFFLLWIPVKYMFNIVIGRRKKLNFKKINNTVTRRKTLLDNLKIN